MRFWEYTTETMSPEEKWQVLRDMGKNGWEAWHLEKSSSGWCEIYFKRRVYEK